MMRFGFGRAGSVLGAIGGDGVRVEGVARWATRGCSELIVGFSWCGRLGAGEWV